MRTIPVLTILAAFALVPSAARADCKSDAKNLLAARDCGFSSGIAGWEASGSAARVSHDTKDGDPQAGALEVMAPDGSLLVSGPCLAAKPSTTYRYGARFRRVSGETYVCGPQIQHFADAACEEPLGHLAAMADLLETAGRGRSGRALRTGATRSDGSRRWSTP